MSNTLTLEPSAAGQGCSPDQEPWRPTGGGRVAIVNSSGFEQQLTNITNGALNQSPHGVITIRENECWQGTVGRGGRQPYTYDYNDGEPAARPRTGTIDPS